MTTIYSNKSIPLKDLLAHGGTRAQNIAMDMFQSVTMLLDVGCVRDGRVAFPGGFGSCPSDIPNPSAMLRRYEAWYAFFISLEAHEVDVNLYNVIEQLLATEMGT